MEPSKTRTYLLYAIGEILLVVIGILIALQINNWNEYRIERNMERDLLIQLRSEYESNLVQLDEKILMRDNMIHSSMRLLEYVDHPEFRNADSTYYFLGWTIMAPTFDPVINDIISSGRIQLLQNSELRSLLTRWTSDIVQVTEEEEIWMQVRSNHYRPLLSKNISMRNLANSNWKSKLFSNFQLDRDIGSTLSIGDSQNSRDINDVLDNPEFEGYIAQCLTIAKITNSQSQSVRNRIIEILDLIDKELTS